MSEVVNNSVTAAVPNACSCTATQPKPAAIAIAQVQTQPAAANTTAAAPKASKRIRKQPRAAA